MARTKKARAARPMAVLMRMISSWVKGNTKESMYPSIWEVEGMRQAALCQRQSLNSLEPTSIMPVVAGEMVSRLSATHSASSDAK